MKKKPYTLVKRGKIFYVRYYIESKRYEISSNETAAYQAHSFARAFLKRNLKPRTNFRDYAGGFFKPGSEWIRDRIACDKPVSSVTAQMRQGHLDNYLLPALGSLGLAELNTLRVFRTLRDLPLSGQTKNHITYTLNIILRQALDEGLIESVSKLRRFGQDDSNKRDAFTIDDLKLLFPKSAEALLRVWIDLKWAALYLTMLTTGMRRGEAAALLWEHVIWSKSGILVLQAVKADNSIALPKGGDMRAVIMPQRTLETLTTWHEATPFPDPAHYVFHGDWGDKHIFPQTISKKFHVGLKNSKIQIGGRNLTAHSLRHTYNTRMQGALTGESLRYMIGHKNEAMTKLYLHKGPEERLLELLPEQKKIDEAWD